MVTASTPGRSNGTSRLFVASSSILISHLNYLFVRFPAPRQLSNLYFHFLDISCSLFRRQRQREKHIHTQREREPVRIYHIIFDLSFVCFIFFFLIYLTQYSTQCGSPGYLFVFIADFVVSPLLDLIPLYLLFSPPPPNSQHCSNSSSCVSRPNGYVPMSEEEDGRMVSPRLEWGSHRALSMRGVSCTARINDHHQQQQQQQQQLVVAGAKE